jgi:hypothetical protein
MMKATSERATSNVRESARAFSRLVEDRDASHGRACFTRYQIWVLIVLSLAFAADTGLLSCYLDCSTRSWLSK